MQREENPRSAVYTLTLGQFAAVASASAARPSISDSLKYLIWTIETAADEQERRDAMSMLEGAIESYIDEVTERAALCLFQAQEGCGAR